MRFLQGGQGVLEDPHRALGVQGAELLDQLAEVLAFDQLHRVPQQAVALVNVVDADDVGVLEARGQPRLAVEPLDHLRVARERGVEDLERDFPFQPEVADPVHPAERAAAHLAQQLVVVAQGAAEPPLPQRRAGLHVGGRRAGVRAGEVAGVAGEVGQHFAGGEVAFPGAGGERAQQDPLEGRGAVGPQLARRADRIAGGRARRGVVEHRARGIDVRAGIAALAAAHLGGQEREVRRRVGDGHRREHQTGVTQVGDDGAAGDVEHERGGQDAADHDPADVGVLQAVEQVAGYGEHGGHRARAARARLLQALALDPVPAAPRQLAQRAGRVGVADGRVVELRDDLGLLEEPRPARRARVRVDAQRDLALEHRVRGQEQQPLVRPGDQPFDLEPALEVGDVPRHIVHAGGKLTPARRLR